MSTIGRILLDKISNFFWPKPKIAIKPGQSVVVIGRPGSGKSTFLRWLLKDAKSVIVYDSKYDPNEWPQQTDYAIVEKAGELALHPRVVLRCKAEWLYNTDDWQVENHPWGIALEHPMQRGDTIAVFDEALATWPVRGGHPGTHRLVQQGRSFRVIVIVGSQLANNIDTRLLRMANHIFVLGPCRHKTELEALLAANHADTTPLQKLRSHQIAWWSDDQDHWTIFKALKVNRPHVLRQKRVKVFETHWGRWILSLISIGIVEVLALRQFGIIATSLIHTMLIFYWSLRFWMSHKWEVNISSGEWIPAPIEQVTNDNDVRKRSPKSFRIV